MSYPRITIVTPSYNQGQFLEETILSVLNQNYPNLEYFIFDGGSTDRSVDIIKKYADKVTYWVSEPDDGQAAAINRGFGQSTGEWFNWLNSDDILMPNALFALASVIESNPTVNWISGAKINIDKNGFYGAPEIPWMTDAGLLVEGKALFAQDATFVRSSFMNKNKIGIRPEYRYAMDTTLYYELLSIEKPLLTTIVFSAMRWHENQKSGQTAQRIEENVRASSLYQPKRTRAQRILTRLSKTRFSHFMNIISGMLAHVGFLSSAMGWKAWVFDHWTNTYQLRDARKCIRY